MGAREGIVMARRKKKKPSTHLQIKVMEIDNPNFQPEHAGNKGNPKRVRAAFNMKESPVMWMLARGYVTEPQAMAATEFRRLYEQMGGAGARAIDFTQEPVDGGGVTDPITDRLIDAAKALAEVQRRLGPVRYNLVEQVCGQCIFIKQLASSKWYQLKMSRELKNCLDILAVDWGFQTVGIRSTEADI
ncbi:MAG: hypothetical protein GY807_04520 [Gammaproteobacteria bacterium]|nr:hypothetical protein [Gammaproteobacteria bacterium]